MAINGITDVLNSGSSVTSKSKELGKDDFLKLLVAQLRFQDPLKPLEDKEFIAQLAQFNSLEQMINLNKNFEESLSFQQLTQASSLIGKEVSGVDTAKGEVFTGVVQKIRVEGSEVKIVLPDRTVSLGDITSIAAAQ